MITVKLTDLEFLTYFIERYETTLLNTDLLSLKRVQDTLSQDILDNKANLCYIKELEEDVEHNHNSMLTYSGLLQETKKELELIYLKFDLLLNLIKEYSFKDLKEKLDKITYAKCKEALPDG